LDDETVYRIDKCMLEQLAEEKLDPPAAPTLMSVDERGGPGSLDSA
jgi:hypothetical protein